MILWMEDEGIAAYSIFFCWIKYSIEGDIHTIY